MDGSFIIIWLVAAMICGIIAAAIAEKKKREVGGWFVLGLFIGPLAILVIAALDPRSGATPAQEVATPQISVTDELAKLADLRDRGALTDEEFAVHKARLLY